MVHEPVRDLPVRRRSRPRPRPGFGSTRGMPAETMSAKLADLPDDGVSVERGRNDDGGLGAGRGAGDRDGRGRGDALPRVIVDAGPAAVARFLWNPSARGSRTRGRVWRRRRHARAASSDVSTAVDHGAATDCPVAARLRRGGRGARPDAVAAVAGGLLIPARGTERHDVTDERTGYRIRTRMTPRGPGVRMTTREKP